MQPSAARMRFLVVVIEQASEARTHPPKVAILKRFLPILSNSEES